MLGTITSLNKFKKVKKAKEKLKKESTEEWEKIAHIIFSDSTGATVGLSFRKSGKEMICAKSGILSNGKDIDPEYDSNELNTGQDAIDVLNRVKARLAILSQQDAQKVWMIEKVMDALFPISYE